MARKIARFYDDLIITPPKFVNYLDKGQKLKITDNVMRGVNQLNVTVAATHASRITRNNTLYLPTKMKQGLPSLLSRQDGGTSPSPPPVFINHNKYDPNGDPIGRVRGAEYIDLQNSLLDSAFGDVIQDMNLDRPEQQFYQFMDALDLLMASGALYNKEFKGSGYIRAILNITNQDSIEKFLDGRYVTVSTSFASDKAVCSICREDWADLGEPCEHKPGQWYEKDGEKHKCFLVPGSMEYEEISVAHRPGDEEAIVLSMENTSTAPNGSIYTAAVSDTYEPYELKWHATFNDTFDPEGGHTMKTREEILTALKEVWPKDAQDLFEKIDDSINDETLQEVHGLFQDTEEIPGLVELAKRLGIEVPDDVENVDQNADEDGSDDDEDENNASDADPDAGAADLTDDDNKLTFDDLLDKMVEDTELTDAEADVMYELISKEIDGMISDDVECTQLDLATSEVVEVVLADAKLSSEQRKKLSSGTFCGPGRSFPVPDCAHVTAAKRLIGKYKGPGDKNKILACVDRKARAMGCDSKKKVKDTADEVTVLGLFRDTVKDMENTEIVAIYQAVESAVTERDIIPAVECANCSDVEQKLDQMRVQRDELNENLVATREELHDTKRDAESYMEQWGDTVTAYRKLLVENVASMKKMNGSEVSYQDLCEEIVDKTRSELENDYNDLHGNFNFDTISVGSNQELPEQLNDPTLTVQDENVNHGEFDPDLVPMIVKRYQDLLEKSKAEAEGYLLNMTSRKFIPTDFDITEHLSQEDEN